MLSIECIPLTQFFDIIKEPIIYMFVNINIRKKNTQLHSKTVSTFNELFAKKFRVAHIYFLAKHKRTNNLENSKQCFHGRTINFSRLPGNYSFKILCIRLWLNQYQLFYKLKQQVRRVIFQQYSNIEPKYKTVYKGIYVYCYTYVQTRHKHMISQSRLKTGNLLQLINILLLQSFKCAYNPLKSLLAIIIISFHKRGSRPQSPCTYYIKHYNKKLF
eukprot:TRINITY_DN5114_c1_g1_i2.p1 TRINITY_DN5114_c1_g1~~TRINITY_DN5114_c1_g1_i2.p1  ORF type:complete len:216 (+),score=-22.95 TRINITY_DN5114_c1_g1_i2:106-753(+)